MATCTRQSGSVPPTKRSLRRHVLSGSVRFGAERKLADLSPGNIAALDREVAHDLEALEESVVLLITAIE
jgi:quercetin dioxygenase-like cupin family protein